jgi:proteasome lid subunit RPN8/RPN11
MVLKIRRKDLDKILRHVRECYPLEACGILVGRKVEREKIVEKVYATRNILESGFEYKIDPSEQLKIFEKAEIKGFEV